jgi:3-oxoacyl-[acyl-carrier-protein] synthase-3
MSHGIGILETGSYLPEREVGNEEVAAPAGVTCDWIEQKTHILTRRYAASDDATSDLAARAAMSALDRAGLRPEEISHLIVSTSTGDFPQPPTAHLVQHAIGARTASCFDINVVCSGFVYGLQLARALISLDGGGYALVIGAEIYSRVLDTSDRKTAILLGDGAGAAIVGEVLEPYGIIDMELRGDGSAHELIKVHAGGSRQPTSHETVDAGGHLFRMDGRGVRDFVMEQVPIALADLAFRANVALEHVDHLVPHQPNGVLLTQLVEKCGLADSMTHRTLEKYGNIGSASVPVALDEANRAGALRDSDLVMLASFGGGMSIGACLLRWGGMAAISRH